MALAPGTRIGPYEVTGTLGAGGMGEVYRARDAKLNRDIALKILPGVFASDPDRLARFKREAQVLASLNHPNIAQIYGFEDTGGIHALVMELVDGQTLAELIAGGEGSQASRANAHGLELDDALKIARQVVDALEGAHEQGIVHRDLKPANVKVREDGTVKVLDFGLAKAQESAQGSGLPPSPRASAGQASAQGDLSNSPTITSPAMTAMGMILGTAAYMAPEQAKGRPVDERADIWAFGCLLFEMLTGRRAFAGDDVSDTLANILKSEPDWSALPDSTPPALRRLLRRCLSKDLAGRLPDIRVARLEIDEATSPDGESSRAAVAAATPATTSSRWPLVALAVAVAALLGVLPIALSHLRETPAPAATVRFSVPPPDGQTFMQAAAFASLSPDGQHLVYCGAAPSKPLRLWLYSMATQDARELAGTDEACGAFWSPDSRTIAFIAGERLKRLDIAGGSAQTIAEIKGTLSAGSSWNRDGTIILGNAGGGLMRVPAGGGDIVPLTALDSAQKDVGHILPQFLPDGRRFLFTVLPTNVVRLGSLDSPSQSELLKVGTHAWYASPGYLVYARQGGTLVAQPFDASSATVSGDPVRVAEGVRFINGVFGLFSTSDNGVLVYESGETVVGGTPVWVDRNGRTTPVVTEGLGHAEFPRLSPDGRRLALMRAGDLWVQDLAGRPPIRLTFDGKVNAHFTPLWSPDGQRIVYESQSPSRLQGLSSDGSNAKPTPVGPEGHLHAHVWSPDARELLAVRMQPEPDIVALPAAGETAPREVVATPAREGFEGLAMSPDGRWIAYAANPTGQMEIWVRPYPGPGAPVRVSPSGGAEPVWARNGRELFYLDLIKQQVMAVAIQTGPELRFSAPVALFSTTEFALSSQPPSYDVATDGRLIMIKAMGRAKPGTRPLTVILNWAEEVKRATAGR